MCTSTCISIDPAFLAFPAFLYFPPSFSRNERELDEPDLRPVFQRELTRVSRIKAALLFRNPSPVFQYLRQYFATVEKVFIECENPEFFFPPLSLRRLYSTIRVDLDSAYTFSLIGQPPSLFIQSWHSFICFEDFYFS